MAKHALGDMRFVRMNHVFTRNVVDLYRNGQPTSQAQNSFLQAEMRAMNNKYVPQIPPFPLTKVSALPAQLSLLIYLSGMQNCSIESGGAMVQWDCLANTPVTPSRRCWCVPNTPLLLSPWAELSHRGCPSLKELRTSCQGYAVIWNFCLYRKAIKHSEP